MHIQSNPKTNQHNLKLFLMFDFFSNYGLLQKYFTTQIPIHPNVQNLVQSKKIYIMGVFSRSFMTALFENECCKQNVCLLHLQYKYYLKQQLIKCSFTTHTGTLHNFKNH